MPQALCKVVDGKRLAGPNVVGSIDTPARHLTRPAWTGVDRRGPAWTGVDRRGEFAALPRFLAAFIGRCRVVVALLATEEVLLGPTRFLAGSTGLLLGFVWGFVWFDWV